MRSEKSRTLIAFFLSANNMRYEGLSRRKEKEFRRQEAKRRRTKVFILFVVVLIVGFAVGSFFANSRNEEEGSAGEADKQQMEEQAEEEEPSVEKPKEEPKEEKVSSKVPVLPKEEAWKIVLVNKDHALDQSFKPEMVQVDNRGFLFDKRAADAMKQMLGDAQKEGLSPMICSSFRPYERQNELFNKQVQKQEARGLSHDEAVEKAKTIVAYPGTSEHQTGLVADIVATSYQVLEDSQEDTKEQQWLMKHCSEYGFILRYPRGKAEYTGVIYEPWHYRYVGKEVAQYITKNNLTLEEYWLLLDREK